MTTVYLLYEDDRMTGIFKTRAAVAAYIFKFNIKRYNVTTHSIWSLDFVNSM